MSAQGEGLRGVVVGESEICDVQADGHLYYRGYDIHDLAEHATFEEVVYLLWHGDLPTPAQLGEFHREIRCQQTLPQGMVDVLASLPGDASAMDALRTGISALGMFDRDQGDNSEAANRRKAARIQARIPAVVAAAERLRSGQQPVEPRDDLGIAANFLYMLTGTVPDDLHARTLDIDFTLHADHELNASTFAARVTVATGADMYSGIVSGIGALSGPRHGGAAEETMEMLLAIGTPDKVDSWVRPRLTGEKRTPIPGFGHAVYRAPDPRARHLRAMSHQLGVLNGDTKYYDMTIEIEKIVDELTNTPERLAAGKQAVYANVDCFSASCYHAMGMPLRLFTPLFAISRTSGWVAHILEQQKPGQKIIRPRAEYTGARNRHYKALSAR